MRPSKLRHLGGGALFLLHVMPYNNNFLQLGCHPVAVVILHVYKIQYEIGYY